METPKSWAPLRINFSPIVFTSDEIQSNDSKLDSCSPVGLVVSKLHALYLLESAG